MFQVMSRRSSRFVLALGVLLSLVSIPAHGFELISADPVVDSTITTAPSAITLTFSSDLTETGSSLSVRAPSGMAVDDGSILIDGGNVLIGLKGLSESGRYTVTYQFMSVAGELLSGSYVFTYDAPAVLSSPEPSATLAPAPEESQATPAEATGQSSRATDIFMIALLVVSFLVLIFIGRSLRKPKSKKRKKK